jgi:hypothetical protein
MEHKEGVIGLLHYSSILLTVKFTLILTSPNDKNVGKEETKDETLG